MRATICVGGLLLYLSGPALAQETTPAVEVSGGYSFVRDQDIEESFHGWVASVAGNFNRWLGIVGEVGGNYKTKDLFGTDVDFSMHSFLGGPRFSGRQSGVSGFGQVLFGGTRLAVGVLGETESSTNFAIQPGGGVDFWMSPRFAIRVGGDYRRIFPGEDQDEGVDEFRFYAGVVVGAGTR